MDSYHDKVVADIHLHLDVLAQAGSKWVASWVAHDVCHKHEAGLVEGGDADFYRWTAYKAVRDIVRRVIRDRAGDGATEQRQAQILLPGFDREHLQDYYLVKRDDEEVAIPVVDMSDQEIASKIALLRAMASSCHLHADELDRYREWRRRHDGAAA